MTFALCSGADKDSTVEYYGEVFTRKWKVLETGECTDFGLARSS